MTDAGKPKVRRMRPPDDPEQTPFHIGFRFIWFWAMPVILVAMPFLLWDIYHDLLAGEPMRARTRARGYLLFPGYVFFFVAWIYNLRRFVRARRRGETPRPLSFHPTPVDEDR